MNPLVSTDWLAAHLSAPDIRVADASWYLPQAGRDAKAEYRSAHIPRAVFFDIDDLSDEKSALPHMLAPAPKFASRMRRLGLGDGNTIVVYDGAGIYSAARAWWMLRAMGHVDVAVLDGGLPKWRAEGRPLEDMIANPSPRHFTPRPNNAL
ncbi:MAG TPA: rhodanese-like domain-containing protein, partial [Rhizomicrobium sp.]|nr:rhodanese-like domain-containing protein [Rhizomicrobium sp.]